MHAWPHNHRTTHSTVSHTVIRISVTIMVNYIINTLKLKFPGFPESIDEIPIFLGKIKFLGFRGAVRTMYIYYIAYMWLIYGRFHERLNYH